MNKFKHKKNKNTAFLYEVLVLELTKAVLSKNKELQNKITSLLKESFSNKTIIGKELKFYKILCETDDVDVNSAEKILLEVKKEYAFLKQEKLKNEQSILFQKIKELLGPQVFLNFVPNYRSLASISQIFNQDVSLKTRVLLEKEIVENMSNEKILKEERQMLPIDNLVLKTFVGKFNEKYSLLHEEQKKLLSKYIASSINNGVELKLFLNEEIGRLKKEIKESEQLEEIKSDNEMFSKIKEVSAMLESFCKTIINEEMILKVANIQNLIREIRQ